MASSNSASINNLNIGVFNNEENWNKYYELIRNQEVLCKKISLLRAKHYNRKEDKLRKMLMVVENNMIDNYENWSINYDNYLQQHELFYDEKFKENTKRKKGRYSQLKFSEKADKRLIKSWVKQDVGIELYVSNKTFKSDLVSDYKQGNLKNFRKSSRQQFRQQISKM